MTWATSIHEPITRAVEGMAINNECIGVAQENLWLEQRITAQRITACLRNEVISKNRNTSGLPRDVISIAVMR